MAMLMLLQYSHDPAFPLPRPPLAAPFHASRAFALPAHAITAACAPAGSNCEPRWPRPTRHALSSRRPPQFPLAAALNPRRPR